MIKQFKQMFAAGNWAHPARDSEAAAFIIGGFVCSHEYFKAFFVPDFI